MIWKACLKIYTLKINERASGVVRNARLFFASGMMGCKNSESIQEI